MNEWGYQRETFSKVEPGDHRVVIVDAKQTTSKAGNAMIVVTVSPNGSSMKINHYMVKNEYFNRNMTEFFDSFTQIDEGDFNFLGWIGCVGAAKLKLDDNGYLKVARFIGADKADKLPAWKGEVPERQTVTDFEEMDDDSDIPF